MKDLKAQLKNLFAKEGGEDEALKIFNEALKEIKEEKEDKAEVIARFKDCLVDFSSNPEETIAKLKDLSDSTVEMMIQTCLETLDVAKQIENSDIEGLLQHLMSL